MGRRIIWTGLCAILIAVSVQAGQNLIVNGDFSDTSNPLRGWRTDYRWLKNAHYMDNYKYISVVPRAGMHRNVAKLEMGGGHPEVKMESSPIKFEQGYQYTCTLDVKGGPYQMYFAGFKWQPGIRPTSDPQDGELRTIYRSKRLKGKANGWKRISFQLPGVKPSSRALKHLGYVRFLRVYIFGGSFGSPSSILIDNVEVTKKPKRF